MPHARSRRDWESNQSSRRCSPERGKIQDRLWQNVNREEHESRVRPGPHDKKARAVVQTPLCAWFSAGETGTVSPPACACCEQPADRNPNELHCSKDRFGLDANRRGDVRMALPLLRDV